jgi:5-methylcytosine-specific restriction endonuclease McrA
MPPFVKKPKRGQALWRTVNAPGFKAQAARLHPENSRAGGIRYRSVPETVRMEIYRPIAEMFKREHPLCQICLMTGNTPPRYTDDVHHAAGRDGLLLFDTRNFVAACRTCHTRAGAEPDWARSLGVTVEAGKWRKQRDAAPDNEKR